ncbi:unnamed protein product [Calicophoron daubneyi]|uniref:Uncharacterized protein n=1 Tax=Calicophoron daubneyi TaxID=300641 RepID=A0AAV2T4W1_CALDB
MHAITCVLIISCLCGMIFGAPTETTTGNNGLSAVKSTIIRLAQWIKLHTQIDLHKLLNAAPPDTTAAAPPDTTAAAPPDTTAAAPPDTTAGKPCRKPCEQRKPCRKPCEQRKPCRKPCEQRKPCRKPCEQNGETSSASGNKDLSALTSAIIRLANWIKTHTQNGLDEILNGDNSQSGTNGNSQSGSNNANKKSRETSLGSSPSVLTSAMFCIILMEFWKLL